LAATLCALLLGTFAKQAVATPLIVASVNHPLQALAERVGGDRIQAIFPLPAEGDPAEWRPDPETVAQFQRADLVLLNGVGYARWFNHVSLPLLKLVDTSAAFHDRLLEEDAPEHSHGPDGAAAHQSMAFTTWLDLQLAIEQTQAIAKSLTAIDRDGAAQYSANLAEVKNELGTLDGRLRELGAQLDGRPVIFSHPVYQYFRHAYGINGRALHWEPNVSPDAGGWRDLDELLAEHPATLMVWEDEPDRVVVNTLAAKGVSSVVFKPIANHDAEGGFFEVMRANVERLEVAVKAMGEHDVTSL
jgi:zinc transport system substrate-binding protein